MHAIKCKTCGTINPRIRIVCRDCGADLAPTSEPASASTTLGFNVRVVAAMWFALASLIPIALTVVLVHTVVILITPIAVPAAAFWGFTFGATIADVTVARSVLSTLLRGMGVALFAFITFLAVSFLFASAFAGNISITGFFSFFAIAFILGGWVALIVGAVAGYGLYRYSFTGDQKLWILQQPRFNRERYGFLFKTTISILSFVMLVLLVVSYFGFGKDAARKKLEDEVSSAAMQGRAESLRKVLSDPSLDPNYIQQKGTSLLRAAIYSKNPEIITILLQHGADPNGIHGSGTSVLAGATSENELVMMRILIEGGADVNLVSTNDNLPFTDNKMSPLIYAAKNNNIEALQLLLENGADTNIRDRKGVTALGYVVQFRKRILPNPDGSPSDLMQLNDAMIATLNAHGATE